MIEGLQIGWFLVLACAHIPLGDCVIIDGMPRGAVVTALGL